LHVAYVDKLDGKIPEELWERKMGNGGSKSSRSSTHWMAFVLLIWTTALWMRSVC
jgi:hypothetical protein